MQCVLSIIQFSEADLLSVYVLQTTEIKEAIHVILTFLPTQIAESGSCCWSGSQSNGISVILPQYLHRRRSDFENERPGGIKMAKFEVKKGDFVKKFAKTGGGGES